MGVVLVLYILLPLLFALLDVFMCFIGLVQPDTWATQLSCVERTCFREGGDAFRRDLHGVLEPPLDRGRGESCGASTDQPRHRAVVRVVDRVLGRSGRGQWPVWIRTRNGALGGDDVVRRLLYVPRPRAPRPVAPGGHDLRLRARRGALRRRASSTRAWTARRGTWKRAARGLQAKPRCLSEWSSMFVKHRDFDYNLIQDFSGKFLQLKDERRSTNSKTAHDIAKRGSDAWSFLEPQRPGRKLLPPSVHGDEQWSFRRLDTWTGPGHANRT